MQKSRREDTRKRKKKRSYELNQKSVGDTRYLEMEG
jgi:hypothetical protein